MSEVNKEIEIVDPRMVKSHDVKLDAEYAEWIAEENIAIARHR